MAGVPRRGTSFQAARRQRALAGGAAGRGVNGPLRLGFGEYAPKDGYDGLTPAGFARLVLLSALVEEAPTAVEDVGARTWPVLAAHRPLLMRCADRLNRHFGGRLAKLKPVQLAAATKRARKLDDDIDRWLAGFLKTYGQGFSEAWIDEMRGWMAAWNLGDADHPELATIAFGLAAAGWGASERGVELTLHQMVGLAAWLARPLGPVRHPVDPSAARQPRIAQPPPWDRFREDRACYVERARAEFERQLTAQLDAIEAEAQAAGDEPTPIKRTGAEHFRWLVRYQVRGERFAHIARDVCRGTPTVKEAVQETAALLDLPLRAPDPPGRPRKTRAPRIVRVESKAA